ncbi:M23 family metallopeptidase [Plantactinospora sp. B24E8]|uniref:murein hydrolase activator EnvC family protein n=1 Tax=Plantactinospora sp. B24E8 TaxID=3153567 RepID=UPI00325DED36
MGLLSTVLAAASTVLAAVLSVVLVAGTPGVPAAGWSGALVASPAGGSTALPPGGRVGLPSVGSVVPVRRAPADAFRWPLDGTPRLVRKFDPPPRPWARGHRGVDLVASSGATVRAAGAGVVLFAGMVAGRPVVSVAHPNGLRTTYEPVRPEVRAGDRVAAGDPLGSLQPGHPGCPTVSCLHWGLRRGEEYLDPLLLLGLGRVRLLPVDVGSGHG